MASGCTGPSCASTRRRGDGNVLVTLATPYADMTAADLTFALGLPALPALHVLTVEGIELRLLGASHQILRNNMSETVACLPGHRPDLPSTVDHQGYRFTAEIHRLTPRNFTQTVTRLRERATTNQHAIVGVFPGDRAAVTILSAHRNGWHTWHAYPQTGELVETRTELRR